MALETEEIIAVEGLCVRRGPAAILNGVNWHVKAGENWVIMGANGSGKTSLLSVLAGYLTPSSGTVRVCGKNYGEFPWQQLRAMLGLVSSSVKRMIQPDFTALEIVASGKGAVVNPWEQAPEADLERAFALMEQSGIGRIRDSSWELISQGERQRVLICRALMADPKLLILDEPCTGLDPVAQRHFLEFIQSAASREGAPAMVLVTHHVEEITPAFSHALVLRHGHVLTSGPVAGTIRNDVLSEAFGEPVRLTRVGQGWRLE